MSSDADDQLKPEDWTIDERDAEQDAGQEGRPAPAAPGTDGRDPDPGDRPPD